MEWRDAWRSCGTGEGLTVGDAPIKRIDYLFLRRRWRHSAAVLETRASDHRPVRVR